jgi:hypothetical protein
MNITANNDEEMIDRWNYISFWILHGSFIEAASYKIGEPILWTPTPISIPKLQRLNLSQRFCLTFIAHSSGQHIKVVFVWLNQYYCSCYSLFFCDRFSEHFKIKKLVPF